MSNNTHPFDYAFPVAPGDVPYWQPGMTLRDWFAGQALAGTIQMLQESNPQTGETWDEMVARNCYDAADAMIAARSKGGDT